MCRLQPGGFASRNYLDFQYPQMNLINLATCGLSFSAVESSMNLRRTLSSFLETLTFVSACWWFCFPELPRPPVPADEFEQSCNMRTEFQRSGIFDEVAQWRTLSTFLETLTFVSACWWFCFPVPRPPVPADEFEQSCNMWTEFQCSGNFDEVLQRRTLSTFLEALTFVSARWWFCFPELPRPPVPADEFEQSCNMWTEVVQWHTLSTFLETLTFVSACWYLDLQHPQLNSILQHVD